LGEKSERITLLGRARHRGQGNIKMDLEEKRFEGVHRIHVTQDMRQ
jgi:hypothetical protein